MGKGDREVKERKGTTVREREEEREREKRRGRENGEEKGDREGEREKGKEREREIGSIDRVKSHNFISMNYHFQK